MTSQVTIVASVHEDPSGTYLKLTTWGVSGGVYGSLGSVRVRSSEALPGHEIRDVARLVLTALYGLDYDL